MLRVVCLHIQSMWLHSRVFLTDCSLKKTHRMKSSYYRMRSTSSFSVSKRSSRETKDCCIALFHMNREARKTTVIRIQLRRLKKLFNWINLMMLGTLLLQLRSHTLCSSPLKEVLVQIATPHRLLWLMKRESTIPLHLFPLLNNRLLRRIATTTAALMLRNIEEGDYRPSTRNTRR